jgi:hypothetical protein
MTDLPVPYNAAIRASDMPARIKRLPVSPRGYPVPFFVAFIDGVPDFRVIGPGKIVDAVKHKKCWVCGEPLGRTFAMSLGPMCAVSRTISEPPSHRECAVYAAIACPFLSNPRMRRNETAIPADARDAAGTMLKRNPGTVAVWLTRGYRPWQPPGGGVLFSFDDPTEVLWFAEGRTATRDEVEASIYSGLPLLEAEAAKEGPHAIKALHRMTADALRYMPQPGAAP